MAAPSATPALPWATRPEEEQPHVPQTSLEEEPEPREVVALETTGYKLGDRIEVMWMLKKGGEVFSSTKWWGATICEVDPKEPVWQVDYTDDEEEEDDEDGEEEEEEQGAGEEGEKKAEAREEGGAEGKGGKEKGGKGHGRDKGSSPSKQTAAGQGSSGAEAGDRTEAGGDGAGTSSAAAAAAASAAAASAAAAPAAAQAGAAAEEGDGHGAPPEGWERPQHIYCLKYDEEENFLQESRNVTFLDDHWVHDLRNGGDLAFRKEGDSWEPIVEFNGRATTEEERQRALTDVTNDLMQTMSHLDPMKQRVAAVAVREIADSLEQLISSKGNTGVVDADDIHEMFRQLKRRRNM